MNEQLTFDDVFIAPGYSEVISRSHVSLQSKFTRNYDISIPLVAAPMDTVCGYDMVMQMRYMGAIGCPHRFMSLEEQRNLIRETTFNNHTFSPIVATIGANGDYQERTEVSLEAGANIILIDVAHGDHVHVKNALAWLNALSTRAKFDVIAGNIATAAAAQRLQDWGADALRVGIGGGSMCETRVRTGVGIPQFAAILDVVNVAEVPVISDGGIRYPGDVAKALAAGADSVMIGSLFAGTDEAPGEVFVEGQWPNNRKVKMFRGSASATAKMAVNGTVNHVEGASRTVPCKGSVHNILKDIIEGVKSSFSYVGASSMREFHAKAEFVRVTNAGLIEAHPHGLR